MLRVEDLTVCFGDKCIVDHLNFTVEDGQWLMIAGPNGAGKSTTLEAVTQGVNYTGRVLFEGADMRKKKAAELARCVGVLSQNHFVEYAFSVEEVAAMGRYACSAASRQERASVARSPHCGSRQKRRSETGFLRFLSGSSGEDDRAVDEALALTGMDSLRKQSVLTLSGGELQRTFLAQVFAQNPKLLLLDEPTNHLDLVYQKQIFELIAGWLKTPSRAVISVVHDLSLAKAYGTGVLLMDQGRAVACGPAEEILVPAYLDPVYRMDVYGWMQKMLGQWEK